MAKQCDLFLIDGFSLLFRSYYGYPPNLTTPQGTPINAVYGFVTLMLNAIKQFEPTYFGICLDRKEPTYRHTMFPEYKANRSDPDEEFLVQLPEFKKVIASFDIPMIEMPGFESDDLLGTLSHQFSKEDIKTYIMSGDMDLLQLVDKNTSIVMNKKGVSNYVIYNESLLMEQFDLTPQQFIDYKALKGDASDNIPGVKGVGEKTALSLLADFKTLDGIYDHIDDIKSKSVQTKLSTAKDMAYLSKKLVTIDCFAPVELTIDQFEFKPDWQKVQQTFADYEFKRLIDRIKDFAEVSPIEVDENKSSPQLNFIPTSYSLIDSTQHLDRLLPLLKKGFAFDLETTSLDPQDADIVAISITASKGLSFVIDCRQVHSVQTDLFNFDDQKRVHPLFERLIPLFEDKSIPKILHNAKYEYQVLKYHNIQLNGIYFDTMLAAHLIDSRQSIGLKALAKARFDYDMVEFDDLMKDVSSILDVDTNALASYVADDSNLTFHLYELFLGDLQSNSKRLFFDLEMPLIKVLSEMECAGVQCDINYLNRLSKDYSAELDRLTDSIYKMANNHKFNINSTQQLGEVLFDQLKLPVIKKTKTGRSTDSSVLEKLAKDYDIAKEVLKYRTYKKLLSTYIDRLPELVHPTSQKIHTSFNQAVTATGRLSSNNPNLQNIPTRSSEGQKIRCAFISRFKEGDIVSIDYSQIELRVLAHLAQDDAMIDAFQRGEDIHQATAAKVFSIPYDSVNKSQREQAKTVNFGITYGQSAFALGDQLGISRTDAQSLIDSYFDQFSAIRSFMDDTVKMARNSGYVETMMGRQRMIDDIDSSNRSLQGNAQRIAINTRVQGSAADIIKKAMLMVDAFMVGFSSKMILQVHDELIFDVKQEEAAKITPELLNIMRSAVDLSVPLTVDIEKGKNWGF